MPQTQYILHLKGFVGGSDFDRNYVDYVLGKHSGKPVNVLIDSLGGSVATALSITSAFKNHGDVTAHFVGMNASAATIASLGAKHISIDANAMYLVHKCSQGFFEWGSLNADQFAQLIADCEQIKADLDKLDLNIASMYAARINRAESRKEKQDKRCAKDLLALMQKGGWLSAQEALDWGFVDEITDLPDEAAPKLTDAVASEMAAAGMPIPNIPVADKEGAFARFLSSLASLFKPSNNNQTMTPETKTDPTANSAAPVTEPLAQDTRIAELEAQVAERDNTIASLQAEVAQLKAAPADSTTAVVEEKKSSPTTTQDPIAAYCKDFAEARAILDAIN